jgi:EAL domain-containing protein (putative c-di-GMP-specific phosphodiesterase class I)
MVEWSAHSGMQELTLAVNVSAHQFGQSNFVELVQSVIERTGVRPQFLKLELTESLLAQDLGDIVRKMDALKALGVGFSLDDFGTGYSSLSYLKRLPLDQLKIDQSFVRDVLTDANDASIARTVIALGQNLNLSVIAEGVETEGQRAFLIENGCNIFQGYLFGKPMAARDYVNFVSLSAKNPDS